MAKKKSSSGGAEDRRRRGLKGILVPLTPRQHQLISRAAAMAKVPGPVTRWSAAVLEQAAIATLVEAGVPPEKILPEEP